MYISPYLPKIKRNITRSKRAFITVFLNLAEGSDSLEDFPIPFCCLVTSFFSTLQCVFPNTLCVHSQLYVCYSDFFQAG